MAFGYLQQASMQIIEDTERERLEAYQDNLEAYSGIFPQPLKVEPGDIDCNVRVNVIKPIVDNTVRFLFQHPPEMELPDAADEQDDSGEGTEGGSDDEATDDKQPGQALRESKERWLKECLRLNDWGQFLLDEAQNGAVCGTPYYRLTTDRLIPNAKDPQHPYPRFHTLDPATMRIMYDDRDISDTTGYEWRWNGTDPRTKAPVIKRQLVTREEDDYGVFWLITDQHCTTNSYETPNWITDAETAWEHDYPPIGHWKNLPSPNEVYGQSDVTDMLIASNRSRNFNLSNRAKIIMHHSHPIVYIRGYNGQISELETAIGRILSLPGSVQEVGQIVPHIDGSTAAALDDEIYEAMLEESGTPATVMGRDDMAGNSPSGVALKIRMWPMVAKTETKRKLYGPALIELCRRLLSLGGWGEDNVVSLKWHPIVPTDELNEAQASQFMNAFGWSPQSLIQKQGGNPKDEMDNWTEWMTQVIAMNQKLMPTPGNPNPMFTKAPNQGQGMANSEPNGTPKGQQQGMLEGKAGG